MSPNFSDMPTSKSASENKGRSMKMPTPLIESQSLLVLHVLLVCNTFKCTQTAKMVHTACLNVYICPPYNVVCCI